VTTTSTIAGQVASYHQALPVAFAAEQAAPAAAGHPASAAAPGTA